ncbi:MAG TPA: electron transfer flavoprotein subunit alpha/FixB family protein, partial [Rhodanobacteraceae bacterium]
MILVIAEQREGKLNRATWETIAAAQQLAGVAPAPITVLVPGAKAAAAGADVAAAQVAEVVTLDDAALEPYTADGYTAALQAAIGQLNPTFVLLPHTYQTRDFAPKLAARLDRALITDVTGIKAVGGQPAFVRPMFQGKLTAD